MIARLIWRADYD